MPHAPAKQKIAINACLLHPDLPVEEDGRLNDPVLRENFLTRVYAYSAWQQLCQQGLTRRTLTDFHSRYKYLLVRFQRDGEIAEVIPTNEVDVP